MSTTILNFKKVEVVAESKEVAKEKIEEQYFHIQGDATQAYKNFCDKQGGALTDHVLKAFMLDYLAKKSKNCPGAGFMITLDSAVKDSRERPYKIEDVKNEQGKRKTKRFYKWIDRESKTVICQVDTNKTDAKNAIKELDKSGEYKGHADLVITYDVVEGQAIVATADYTPSINTKNGKWLAFGIEA